MKIRGILYWTVTFFVAAYSSQGDSASAPDAVATAIQPSVTLSTILAVPDAARSALLFIGILAMGYTYQQAWANFRDDAPV